MPRPAASSGIVAGSGTRRRRHDVAIEVQGHIADHLVVAARIAALDIEAQGFRECAECAGAEADIEPALRVPAGEAADRIAAEAEARARFDRAARRQQIGEGLLGQRVVVEEGEHRLRRGAVLQHIAEIQVVARPAAAQTSLPALLNKRQRGVIVDLGCQASAGSSPAPDRSVANHGSPAPGRRCR